MILIKCYIVAFVGSKLEKGYSGNYPKGENKEGLEPTLALIWYETNINICFILKITLETYLSFEISTPMTAMRSKGLVRLIRKGNIMLVV